MFLVDSDDQAKIELELKRRYFFYRYHERDTEVIRKNIIEYEKSPKILNILENVINVSNVNSNFKSVNCPYRVLRK